MRKDYLRCRAPVATAEHLLPLAVALLDTSSRPSGQCGHKAQRSTGQARGVRIPLALSCGLFRLFGYTLDGWPLSLLLYASIYSATEVGTGMERPSARIPSRCIRIASRIRSSTSVCVAPVATHPGKSGENADKLFGVFSMMIRYFVCIILILESSLPQNTVQRARCNIVFEMTGNGYPSRFIRMLIPSVPGTCSHCLRKLLHLLFRMFQLFHGLRIGQL